MTGTGKTLRRAGAWLLAATMVLSMQILPTAAYETQDTPSPAAPISAGAEAKIPQNTMKATASHWGAGDDPQNAIDGNAKHPQNGKTAWASWGREGGDTVVSPQWLMLELDAVHDVAGFEMTGRSNGNNGFITNYDLEISRDGEYFEKLETGATFTVPEVGIPVRYDFAEGTQAKFIKLTANECVPDSREVYKDNFWPAISNFDVFVTDLEPEQPEQPGESESIWPTPILPPQPETVSGVANPVILLNDPEGTGAWQYLFETTGTKPGDENFDFSAWDGENWSAIKVPGEPLMQGFDIEADKEYYYKTTVSIPEDYAGKDVLLRFHGVYSDARVWVEGQFVRKHVGGFTAWDCDITQFAAAGEDLSVVVGVTDNRSNPSYASTYAHHNIGGILRDVELLALPQEHIESIHLETDLDKSFTNAELKLDVKLNRESAGGAAVSFALNGPDGNAITLPSAVLEFGAGEQRGQLTIPVEAPEKWDAEHPNLYELTATLTVGGEVVQINTQKVGFREITYGVDNNTYDGNKIYVNGSPVKLRGTCRHDVSYDLGRTISEAHARAELEAYKKSNINFVRTSHYPPSGYFLELCDELGIYVEDETAICFDYSGSSQVMADYMDQYTEMIESHRNHASVLMWSMGNESFHSGNPQVYQNEWDYVKAADLTRPVIFSWPDQSNNGTIDYDIYSSHYPNYELVGGAGYGRPDENYTTKPVIHDEYAHIPCYNISELQKDPNVRNFWGESLNLFWNNIMGSGNVPEERADGSLGGALWGGIDDVFYIPEGVSERWQSHSTGDVAGYGEWGSVLDVFLREKPEAWLTKKAYSPVRIDEDNITIPQSGEPLVLNAENRFDHTDFSEVTLQYQVNGETPAKMILGSAAPHTDGTITLPARAWALGDTVHLKLYTNYDNVMIDEYNITLGGETAPLHQAGAQAPTVTEDGDAVTVSGGDFSVTFSRSAAQITSGTFRDQQLISGGPQLNALGGIWTPDTQNPLSHEIRDNRAVVHLLGSYSGVQVRFDVAVTGNGIIETAYTLLSAPGKTDGYTQVGIVYELTQPAESVSWKRDGLWSAYPGDHIGRNEGTAYRVREGSQETPDVYGQAPGWAWKDDMRNFFLYPKGSEQDGLVTNDFKAMRENVWYYDVNFSNRADAPHISVESADASVAAQVTTEKEKNYIDDRDPSVKYTGGWGLYDGAGDYAGTETFSTALGDACEFSFTGTGIRFIGAKQQNTGKVKVYLDGKFQEEIDTFNSLGSTQLKQSLIYSADGLENTEHTLRLETSGGKYNCIVVDAFEVIREGVPTEVEKTWLTINNQWYYPGLSWGNYDGISGKLNNGSTGSATIVMSDWDRNEGAIAAEYSIEISADQTSVQAGGDVAVTVTAKGGTFVGAACRLGYDSSKFEVKSIPDGWEDLETDSFSYYNVIGKGFYPEDKVLGTFIFTAKEQRGETSGSFTLSGTYMAGKWEEGWSTNPAEQVPNNGSVTVKITLVPAYVVEVVEDYVAGYSLVLVHTNDEGTAYSYDGKAMYDVTGAGYLYKDTKYAHVYGLVVGGMDISADKVAGAAKSAGTLSYSTDVNSSGKTDLNDAVAVVAVYNANGLYMDTIHADIVLKADVNGDKEVNVDDFGLIKAKYT